MIKHPAPVNPFVPDLPPVEIGLLQPPIVGDHERADGGIGIRHTEIPLVVHIARPPSTPKGTSFEFYWAGVAVAFNQIRDGDENLTRIPFTISQNFIRESWADPVQVRVIRLSGNPSETMPLRLRVNLRRPGGIAPEPTQPGNRKLVLVLPPDVEIDGINDDRAKLGVQITFRHWENMAPYDLLRLAWGNVIIEYRVQPADVGSDIKLTVEYATIIDVGDSEQLPVAFQVIGPTGNGPDPRALWSVITWISVYLRNDRLDPPWLDFPDTAPTIDLAQLGNQHVRIGLYVSAANARIYERVFLIWAGTNENGSVPHIDDQVLPGGRTYYFDVPNALVKAIASGSATVHYLLEGNGQPTKRSHNLFLSVIGEALKWPAPWVVEAVGDIIPPGPANATVSFREQDTWRPDDLIQITLLVSNPNITTEYKQSKRFDSIPNDKGVLSFTVPGEDIKRFDGLRVQVFYTLLRTGQDSLSETYQVGEPKRDMPPPKIEKASGAQLDPDDVKNGAKVIAPFASTRAGDQMILWWTGPLASTQVDYDVHRDGELAEFVVPYVFVERNLDQDVIVSYTLKRGLEPTRYSEITSVLIARGLMDLPPPDLVRATITGPGRATLAPLDALNGSDLVVRYVGMLDTDSIKVSMLGRQGQGSPDIPAKFGNELAGEVVFDIPRQAIAANIGNSDQFMTFKYVVTRRGEPSPDSQILTVKVLPIPLDELQKTIIRINEADQQTQILDLAKVIDGATAHIGTWHFITEFWPVWLTLTGKKNGVNYPITLLNGSGGDLVNGDWINQGRYEHPILATYLNELDHASTLTMEFSAAFSTSPERADAIVFPPVIYSVLKAPPLTIGNSTMILNGRAIVAPGWPRNGQEYPGNAQIREAEGGSPPYSYRSRNPGIATVNLNDGKVRGMANGSTYIDVEDRAGNTASYRVEVSNVWQLRENRAGMNWSQAVAWRKSLPGAVGIYYADGISFMRTVYGSPLPVPYDSYYWLGVEEGCDFLTGVFWDSMRPDIVRCINRNTYTWAWCLQP
ncbi:hypothetical protein [Pseudomonas veronii]|uniref:hypothetical protein n=1 Tax=Pseudomonas veronii TaxID=76761 RepID=UPI00143CE31E|nr:hypothetical protein [Pseudomonas veronii]